MILLPQGITGRLRDLVRLTAKRDGARCRLRHNRFFAAEGITKRFGGLVAVSDVSFEISRGEILGLIGPNGAGKSTIFNLISGFYRVTRGRTVFQGQDVSSLPIWKLARIGLARTFQHDSLLKGMTVRDNILVATTQFIRNPAEREKTHVGNDRQSWAWGKCSTRRPATCRTVTSEFSASQ